jgi:DNA-binding response OmpR family regulator
VDDEPWILDAIQRGLLLREFKVCAFTDALAALDDFSSNSKDHCMISLILKMPGMKGYEVVKQIKVIGSDTYEFFSLVLVDR